MTDSASGTGWEVYAENNVVISEFTDSAAFDESEQIIEAFLEMMESPRIDAHVACIKTDEAGGQEMLNGAEEAAKKAINKGSKKWGIADSGIGKLAIKNHVDTESLEVKGFDSREEAIEWAKK